jgi:hypothetical protein
MAHAMAWRMRTLPIVSLLAFGLGIPLAIGCGSGNPPIPDAVQARLHRASSCGDLEQSLRADALQKMNDAIDRNIASLRRWEWDQSNTLNFEAPQAGATDNAGGATKDSASTYSQTNDQVKGVDEADFVKNDGKYIYLLHGQNFQVVKAWPADQMTPASSIAIEGYPREMFVDSGKVVVFSEVNPQPILDAAGVKQRSTYYDYMGYGFAEAGGGGVRGGAPSDIACAPGYGGCGYYGGLTKITVLTLDDAAKATVVGESWFEGNYFSSRRIGTRVRAVINGGAHGPAVDYWPSDFYQAHANQPNWRPSKGDIIDAYEKLRVKNTQIINASVAADWLPYVFSRGANNQITAQLERCEDFYVPTQGSTTWGLTQVPSLDLATPGQTPDVAAIVGQTDTVYSSTGHMVLASHGWMPYAWYWGWDNPPDNVTLDYTHLHSFNLDADPRVPVYEGSGTIPGSIGDQFSMDEKDGILRVTSTEHRTQRVVVGNGINSRPTLQQNSHNHLYTLQPQGDRLALLGDAGDIAPTESIFSTRFVGNRGYVVTFRQVDPLFVVDLADPAHPKVVGSLTIPGFSSYMHPLDDNHLLTIGRDVDPNTNRQGNLMLQIFDVTNATNPALVQKYVYDSSTYGYSEAQYDHKAFNYFADKQLLSFPFYAYGQNSARSSAELFKIDIANGITKLGSVDHSAFIGTAYAGWCGGWFTPAVRRTVFMDDVLYSISYGGVIATDTTKMTGISALPLAAPTLDGYAACR